MTLRFGPGSTGLVGLSIVLAAVLAAVKWAVHAAGWEFISTLPLLTGLMGGVVFTIAILLHATIRDYKESEQLVAELVAKLRRLYWDLQRIAKGPESERAMTEPLRDMALALREDLEGDDKLAVAVLHGHMARIDEAVTATGQEGMHYPQLRTVQVELIDLTRVVERLEMIIETEALQTGYRLGGAIIVTALAGFLFADIGSGAQASALYGFAAFLLGGLFILVRDLDNPFAGFVRVSTQGLHRVADFLAERVA